MTYTESLFQGWECFNFSKLTCKTEDSGLQAGGYAFIKFGILNNNDNKINCIFDDRIPGEKKAGQKNC